jgi:hypothetical protein
MNHAIQYYNEPLNFTVSMNNSNVGCICIYSTSEWLSVESAYNRHSGINIVSLPLILKSGSLVLYLKNNEYESCCINILPYEYR